MGFPIKKISTSFDFTVQLTYITYKVHCKFSSLLLWPNYVFSLANPTCRQKEFATCVAHISKVKSNITETEEEYRM